MSMRPNVSIACRTAAATWAADRTSTRAVRARTPRSLTSSATASRPRQPLSGLVATTLVPVGAMSVKKRSAPSVASRCAMARPKPRSPPLPVTIATLPLSITAGWSGQARGDALGEEAHGREHALVGDLAAAVHPGREAREAQLLPPGEQAVRHRPRTEKR